MEKQTDRIADYLKSHKGGLTRGEAFGLLLIANFPARVFDMKESGYVFTKISEKNVTGTGHHARWYLEYDPKDPEWKPWNTNG